MVLTVVIVRAGIQHGLERWSRILMPVLLLLLLVLIVNSGFLKGFGRGAAFLFHADFTKLTPQAVLEALGHAFFTLSLGMGAIMTYGSYLREDVDIVRSTFIIAILDTAIALMAGLAIFPVVFTFGLEPGAGPGLIFHTLPVAFTQLPAGRLIATLFFVLLAFAALTSAISLLEVAVAYLVDERGWSRKRATALMGLVIFTVGILPATSGVAFDIMDEVTTNYMLPLGGLLSGIFVGWFLISEVPWREFQLSYFPRPMFLSWRTVIKFITPVAVALVMLNRIGLIRF